MGKTKRIYQKPPTKAELNQAFKKIAYNALHKTFKQNLSDNGEKECAAFITNLETTYLHLREYHKELSLVELSKETVLENLTEEEKKHLTDGQKKAIYSQVKVITKEINLKHHQSLKLFERWLRELDRVPEYLQDYIYELAAK